MRISPIIHRSRDEAEEQALKRNAVHGARTETPAHRLNLLQFVAYRHSLLSVVFRRSHTRFGASVRERVFHLAFATACALYVAMQADIWTSAHADASILAGASTFIALSLTVLLVTPLTLIVRCTYVPLGAPLFMQHLPLLSRRILALPRTISGDWLNDRLPCVEELTRGWMRVEEALLLIFIFRVCARPCEKCVMCTSMIVAASCSCA